MLGHNFLILRKLKEQRPYHRSNPALFKEQTVHVPKQRVFHPDRVPGSFFDRFSERKELLGALVDLVVVSGEGVERTELDPSSTQLLSSIICEPTYIRSKVRDTIDVQSKHLWY